MAFTCKSFTFDGKSCEEFGLEVYDFGSERQAPSTHPTREPVEERLLRKYTPLYYGSLYEQPLEFTVVFGLGESRAAAGRPLDRYEMENIAYWLTGPDGYKPLIFDQEDMHGFHYKARVSALERLELAWDAWAFKATFTCDSAFAYRDPEVFVYTSTGVLQPTLFARSTYNGLYRPKIKIEPTNTTTVNRRTIDIINASLPTDHRDRDMQFTQIPIGIHAIYIDTDTKVVYADSGDSCYPFFNFAYLGLVPGDNALTISGQCVVTFTCEFPAMIGG